jgi:localization factor PodJL
VIPPKNAKFKKAGGWFTRSPKKKKPEPLPALDIKPAPVQMPEIPPQVGPIAADAEDAAPKKTIGQHIKTLLVAASVVVIVLATVQTAINMLSSDEAATPSASAPQENLNINTAPSVNPPNTTPSTPSRPMPTPEGTVPAPDDNGSTNSIKQQQSSFFDPRTVVQVKPQQQPQQQTADVTGSIPRHTPRTPTPADGLPQTITGALRTGIAAQDPAAEYELATRYAEGRGVTQSIEESIRWIDRAAKAGFVPAQFRLASAMEKGEGIKRDVQGARRLYTAAAEKGHAKAMHNLAVLHAEGIDGKPDYRVAAQWFRKAASLGVADSQYNLAILYARGIGTEPNLAESYKWFALAAAKGDKDAAKKRDEVGARLDQKSLTAARLAAQTFTSEPESDDATNLKVPAGGWDRPAVAGAKAKQRTP